MRKLTAFLKKLQFGKILATLLLGGLLLFTTACNSGDKLGARPNNPPVQMGGQNNPHKAGGDGYTDPAVKSSDRTLHRNGDRADLMQMTGQLIASNTDTNAVINDVIDDPGRTLDRTGGLIYPGSGDVPSARSKNDFVSPEQQRKLSDPGQIPAERQPVFRRSDPNAKILEKAGQTFKDASEFLTEPSDDSRNHSELEQVNPFRQKISGEQQVRGKE